MSKLGSFLKVAAQGEILLPLLQDFVAKENRLVAKRKKSKKDITIADARLTIRCFKNRINEFNHDLPAKTENAMVHPSSVGGCMRAMWYNHFDAPRDSMSQADELRSYLIFEVGTYFHVMFQNLLSRAGILLKREVTIVDEKNHIIGHCDGIVKVRGIKYAVELKSINPRQFTLLTKPHHHHIQQAHCYMKSLGLKFCIFLYYDKDRAATKEFVIRYDPAFYVKHVKTRIKRFRFHVRTRKQPERETEGPTRPPCIWCSYADLCYSSDKNKKFVKKVKSEAHETKA